jgi:O-antigen ligase
MKTTVTVLTDRFTQEQKPAIDKPIEQFITEVTTAGTRTTYSDSAIPGQEDLPDEDLYKRLTQRQGVYTPDPALEANLSIGIRLNQEWPTAVRAFVRNPLLGSGFSAMGVLYDNQLGFATDNDYIRNLGESGILGVGSFALIFVVLFRLIHRFLKTHTKPSLERSLVIGFAAAIVGFFLNAVFIDVFEASKLAILFWLSLGILVAVMEQKDQSAESDASSRPISGGI